MSEKSSPIMMKEGLEQFEKTPNAILLDVRSEREYAEGHIPHSESMPLKQLETVRERIPELATPLFLYCKSGVRCEKAAEILQSMGYTQTRVIGGILDYTGPIEQ